MPGTNSADALSVILAFLRDIGFDVVASELDQETCPPGIRIDQDRILYDEARLTYPGDLLHIAAYFAVLPAEQRFTPSPDHPTHDGTEMVAIAWSYAASLHLGLDPDVVFHDDPGYFRYDPETIIENFSRGQFLGVPVLAWRGMTVDPQQATSKGKPLYPIMLNWVCTQPDSVDKHQAETQSVLRHDALKNAENTDALPSDPAGDPSRSMKPNKLPLTPYMGSLMEARQRFTRSSTCLLADDGDPKDFRDAANELYTLFNEIGGRPQDVIGADAFTWQQETLLSTGKAINPYSAATCILDYARTRAFARGLQNAIEAARTRFPDERIDILYAGTGPYAPLALLQTPFFNPDQVRFTLVDIHESALSCQAQIISVLGLEDYVEETVQADATQWIPADGKQFHIVVTEVMQRGLVVEPQVAVTLALVEHLRPGGLLVPERIDLTLCLLDPAAEQTLTDGCADRLSDYFRLSGDSVTDAIKPALDADLATGRRRVIIGRQFLLTDSVAQTYRITSSGRIILPPVQLPHKIPPGFKLRILTGIRTSGDITLGDYDSGLTIPERVQNPPDLIPGGWYEIWYETRGNPGLRLKTS